MTNESTTTRRRTRAAASATTRPAAATASAEPLLQLLAAMQEVNAGDFSVKLPQHWDGIEGKLATAFNDIVNQNKRLAVELARVGQKVGRQGQTRQRVAPANRQGAWAEMEQSVNHLIDDLVRPVDTITEAMAGVAKGDLTRTVPLEADGRPLQGEFLRSANIVNRMIEQMGEFSSEVTRVALEVGTAGLLGGQAKVKGVSGVWKDLTDSVNQMANNLTAQVRNISEVTIAVANGDLSRKITVDVRGEILQLKEAINTMVDQLRGFASDVTRVAREVGTEGKLGGQARVPGVAGTWKDLTDNVNSMASNLTSQVRNIAEVTTAVARGDLSRKITVDAQGEILQLKDTLNTMVDQLNSFAAEVTRVAREVGTEGKLGGQATPGTWVVRLVAIELTLSVRSAQVPATPGTSAWPPSLPSVPTSRATRVTSEAKPLSWSTITLMVFFSSRISPFTSTVIFFDRSPRATAVVTQAMLRTCEVRFDAIEFTLSVRSRHVPDTPLTWA